MSWPITFKSLMYCCCNERSSGSLISAGVRTCDETFPAAATMRISSKKLLRICPV